MNQCKVSGRWWTIGGAFALGLLAASAIRYGLLENGAQAAWCAAATGGWCVVRSAVGWSIHMQLFGLGALALTSAAWIPALRGLALPGLFLAGCGLLVYNATWAGVAAVVGLLAALQPPSAGRR